MILLNLRKCLLGRYERSFRLFLFEEKAFQLPGSRFLQVVKLFQVDVALLNIPLMLANNLMFVVDLFLGNFQGCFQIPDRRSEERRVGKEGRSRRWRESGKR